MSTNCLVTTLKDSVNNNDLLKVGEMRVKMIANTDYNTFGTLLAQTLSVAPGSAGSIISGGSWAANSSNNHIKADANTVISIPDKYSLTLIRINKSQDCVLVNKDVDSLRYLTNLTTLEIFDDELYGDIASISGLTNLTRLVIKPSINVIGDISGIGTKEALTYIDFANTGIGGDVSTLAAKLPAIQELSLGRNCYGDISLVNCNFLYTKDGAPMSWTGNRTSAGKYIMAMENNPDFGSFLDAMLIDQAGCNLKAGVSGARKKIIVKGTHTEGSDWQTAVATLISKGITNVIINGTNYNSGNLPT